MISKKNKRAKNMESPNRLNKRLIRALVFLFRFNLFAIPLYLMLLSGFQLALLKDITSYTAYGMLKITGIEAEISGSVITVPAEGGFFLASVDWDCTGWKSMLALFALIFATDFPLRRKMAGLVLIPAVYIINLIRIWFMFFFVSNFGVAYYSFVHATIWSLGLMAAVLGLWVLWLKTDLSNLKIPTRIK